VGYECLFKACKKGVKREERGHKTRKYAKVKVKVR